MCLTLRRPKCTVDNTSAAAPRRTSPNPFQQSAPMAVDPTKEMQPSLFLRTFDGR
jgi:hypothetical protein